MKDATFAQEFGLTFHHLGYVVADIEAAFKTFASFSGQQRDDCYEFEDREQKVNVLFVQMLTGPLLELVTPLAEDSPVTGFLRQNPFGGYHHIAFEAPDHDASCNSMRRVGFRKITSVTTGFENRKVCFFLPRTGVAAPLIELVSPPNKAA